MTSVPIAPRTLADLRSVYAIASLLALVHLLFPPPSLATYPGQNGHLAFEIGPSNHAISSTAGQLTFPGPTESDSSPAYSPDGEQLAFVHTNLATGASSIEVMTATGADRRTVVDSTALGSNGSISFVTWLADGQHLAFTASRSTAGGAVSSIWTVGMDGLGLSNRFENPFFAGLPTIFELEGAPGDAQRILFKCRLRSSGMSLVQDFCILDATGVSLVPIAPPAGVTFRTLGPAHWNAAGTRIAFTMSYTSPEGQVIFPPNACGVSGSSTYQRSEIFTAKPDGSDIVQVTNGERLFFCGLLPDGRATWGHAPAITFLDAVPSPDGRTMVGSGFAWAADSTVVTGIWSIDGTGGLPSLLLPLEPNAGLRHTNWQGSAAPLTLRIEDGHGHLLKGLAVELRRHSDGALVSDDPINTTDGTYVFDVPLAADTYEVRATLVDRCRTPGCLPAFGIRYAPEPAERVQVTFLVAIAGPNHVETLAFDAADPSYFVSNVSTGASGRLDDMAAVYFYMRQFIDWVHGKVVADTGPTVDMYLFATADPWGSATDPVQIGAYYSPAEHGIVMGPRESDFENRDGIAEAGPARHDDDGPAVEWHEFTHHLFGRFINDGAGCADGAEAHAGYANPNTCDSMNEGFSSFLPALAATELPVPGFPVQGDYDAFGINLNDTKWKPWWTRNTSEEFAIAGLFWDLVDGDADLAPSHVLGRDGLHHPVTYVDVVSSSIGALWSRLTTSHPGTVFDLRRSFGTVAPSRDLDGDGSLDVARLDEVFLLHGMHPVENDQFLIYPLHMTYHYDVEYAQRIDPSAARNAAVGLTSHNVLDGAGNLVRTLVPRARPPLAPHAFVEVHVVDGSGTPVSGTPHTLTIETAGAGSGTTSGAGSYGELLAKLTLQHPNGRVGSITRRLESGAGPLLHLELPPHFDYLLPPDAPLPPCDPTVDSTIQVTLQAVRDGTSSNETPSFDNCTYLHAMAAATGPAALSYTLTLPGSAFPVAAVAAVPNTGSTFEGWGGPDAAECATGSVTMNADKHCIVTFASASSTTITTTTTSTTTTTQFSCDGGPIAGCQPSAPGKSSLALSEKKLTWKWASSAPVALEDFGDPANSTLYLLCVHDQTGLPTYAFVVPGTICGTRSPKPCWSPHKLDGYDFADKTGYPQGVTKLTLRAGSAGKATLALVSSGPSFFPPALPLSTPVRVQLRTDSGACWEANYSLATNTAKKFKAKSD